MDPQKAPLEGSAPRLLIRFDGQERYLPAGPTYRVGRDPESDALAFILTVAAMAMFALAASGRELRRFNEIAAGLVFLSAALICQFTSITNTHIGR